jgi:hypothetical protein
MRRYRHHNDHRWFVSSSNPLDADEKDEAQTKVGDSAIGYAV